MKAQQRDFSIWLATGEHHSDDIGQSCLFRIAFSSAGKPRRIALCSLLACLNRFYFVFAF
jgi:hypothetical protein